MKATRFLLAAFFLLVLLTACSTGSPTDFEQRVEPSSAPDSASQADTSGTDQELDPLSEEIKKAIISENQGKYLQGECYGVGYQVMETFEEDGVVSVYALTEYVEYRFEDNVFVNISGTNPRVLMRFQRTENGGYELMDYTRLDIFSGLSDEELRALMLPLEQSGKDYFYTDRELQQVRAQADADAAEYLKSIGRTARVGLRQDHEGQRLIELVSDKALVEEIIKDEALSRYPTWTGTTERLEDGVRYVYQTDFDEESQTIIFTKLQYDSGHIVESITVDVWEGTFVQ